MLCRRPTPVTRGRLNRAAFQRAATAMPALIATLGRAAPSWFPRRMASGTLGVLGNACRADENRRMSSRLTDAWPTRDVYYLDVGTSAGLRGLNAAIAS